MIFEKLNKGKVNSHILSKMFSDIVFDAIQDILERLEPDYCYPEVYDKEAVISMLASMYYVIALSDAAFPNDDLTSERKKELKQISRNRAEEEYNKRMNEENIPELQEHDEEDIPELQEHDEGEETITGSIKVDSEELKIWIGKNDIFINIDEADPNEVSGSLRVVHKDIGSDLYHHENHESIEQQVNKFLHEKIGEWMEVCFSESDRQESTFMDFDIDTESCKKLAKMYKEKDKKNPIIKLMTDTGDVYWQPLWKLRR